MNKCKQCSKNTKNPKFCGRSCSVSYNNAKTSKVTGNKPKQGKCPQCNKIVRYGLTFCSQLCSRKNVKMLKNKEIEQGLISTVKTLRRYIKERDGYKCSICNIDTWMNKPLTMILDHINGDSYNNHPSNLRFVCSNCDSQLPTYKAKNKGKGRKSRNRVLPPD